MEDIGFKQGFQEQLHDQIRIKYINDKKAILENTRARILEKGFNELLIGLQAQSSNRQGLSPNVGHIAYDLISNYNFPTGLFQAMKINPTQEKQSNFQQGFQFEKDLESLLQTLFSTMFQQIQNLYTWIYSMISTNLQNHIYTLIKLWKVFLLN